MKINLINLHTFSEHVVHPNREGEAGPALDLRLPSSFSRFQYERTSEELFTQNKLGPIMHLCLAFRIQYERCFTFTPLRHKMQLGRPSKRYVFKKCWNFLV